MEARLTPAEDPNLKVEWFKDGKPLPTGHRFRYFLLKYIPIVLVIGLIDIRQEIQVSEKASEEYRGAFVN